MRASRPQHVSLFSWAVHAWLLLSWLLCSHGFAPAFALTAALLDGGHEVKVAAAVKGGVTVVLSHDDEALPSDPHQDQVLGLLIAAFDQNSGCGKPDHVLSFEELHDATLLPRLPLEGHSRAMLHAPVVAERVTFVFFAEKAPVMRAHPSRAWFPGLEMRSGRTVMLC